MIDDHEICLQYVAGTRPNQGQIEKLDVRIDLKRLTQMYLEADCKLKVTMPS